MGRLNGKTAIVLGASSDGNMGQHIARRFMAEGARVLVSGRKADVLQAFADQAGCAWAVCDLTDPASVAALADVAHRQLGGIDIALNATGWGLLKPFLDTTQDELAAMTALQFTGPFTFFQAMVRKMARSLGGRGGCDHPDQFGHRANHAQRPRRLYGHQGRHRPRHPLRRA